MAAYVNLPGWLIDDLRDGKITNKMFNVMVWLFSRANFKTGIVRMCSAKRILNEQWADERENDRPSARSVQELLYRLAACGYIRSHHMQGVRGSYAVTINNYPAVKKGEDGALIEVVLNPTETLDWHDLPKQRCGDKQTDLCGEASGDPSGEASGDASGEASAYTSISPVSSDSSLSPVSGFKEGREGTKEDVSLRSTSFRPIPELVKALADATPYEMNQSCTFYSFWMDKTGQPFLEMDNGDADYYAAIRLIREYGFHEVYDILKATFECPKTVSPGKSGLGWRDFSYWCKQFELTRRTITTWRNKINAQHEAKRLLCDSCRDSASGYCRKHIHMRPTQESAPQEPMQNQNPEPVSPTCPENEECPGCHYQKYECECGFDIEEADAEGAGA